MSEQINDGGPAFPMNASTGDPRDGVYCQNGMSLRDWFAGQALVGYLSGSTSIGGTKSDAAKWAYEFADAMIEARTTTQED